MNIAQSTSSNNDGGSAEAKSGRVRQDESPSSESRHPTSFYIAFVAVVTFVFLVQLDLYIIASTVPAIAADLKSTNTQAYWCGSGYIIAQAVSQPVFGGISSGFGRKIMLEAALLIFLVGSILCSRAQSIQWLIGTRVVQGIGGGGMITLSVMSVTDMTTMGERAKYMSLLSLAHLFGNFGFLMGAGIVQHTTWRWIFYLNIPVCTVVLAVLHFTLQLPPPEARSNREKARAVDWAGIFLLGASLASLLVGLLSGGISHPWSSAKIIVPLVLGVVGGLAFAGFEIFWSKRGQPIFPPQLVGTWNIAVALLHAFVAGYSITNAAYWLIVYFNSAARYGIVHASVAALPTLLVAPFSGLIGGAVIKRTGTTRYILLFGSISLAAGLGSLISFKPTSSVALQSGVQIPLAIGMGLLYIGSLLAVQTSLPHQLHPGALNLLTMVRTIGQAFGVAIGVTIFQNRFRHELNDRTRRGILSPEFAIAPQDAGAFLPQLSTFPPHVITIYRGVYNDSVRPIWYAGLAMAAAICWTALFMRREHLTEPDREQELEALGE